MQEQWVKIPVDKLVRFTGDQIGKIDAASLAALSNKYWDKVPVYQIVHFGVELVQSAGVLENLNATQIGYFTEKQWKAMPVESIVKFTVDKLHAVDYKVLGNWTKKMWDKVPIDTIAAFVYQQIQAVPAEVVGQSHCRLSWYKRAKTEKVSGGGWDECLGIVFDSHTKHISYRRQLDTEYVVEVPYGAGNHVHGRATYRRCQRAQGHDQRATCAVRLEPNHG